MLKPGDSVQFRAGRRGGHPHVYEFPEDYVFEFKCWYDRKSLLVTLQGILNDGTVLEPVVLLNRLMLASSPKDYDPKQQPFDDEDI